MSDRLILDFQLPDVFYPVFHGEARYRGARGGRGSAKSQTFATKLLERGMLKREKVLCAREFQNSIQESVHAELCSVIDEKGLGFFYGYDTTAIWGCNGTEFLYKGLRFNYQSIKSLKGITIAWVEEAEYVSEKSWRTLIPTIRAPGSEIWLTWNPELEDSATKRRFVDNPPKSSKIIQANWRDNPWFPKELEEERQNDLRRDPDGYEHIWEGACVTRSDAQILHGKWKVDTFTPTPEWGEPLFGADWGFANDPSVLLKLWVFKGNLYIEYEAFGMHTELKDLAALFNRIPNVGRYKIRGDNSRPETISMMKKEYGFNIEPAAKWSGSVEDGIEHMRGKYDKIIIHPRCVETIKEARLYSYKVDRLTGDILPVIVDKYNHCMDAARYALDPLIRRKKSFMSLPRT